jgi:1-aminocyclopropane-1-carboxylate deaminase/D-cysteine desulfhydrase-like pyridoxal-dependent ACC family enzyme
MVISHQTSYLKLQTIENFSAGIQSPIVELNACLHNNVRLWMKRDDLIHPDVSGNKWRKLKYNLITARATKRQTLITKGGAFSNQIYAVAAAAKMFGFRSIGIIRGERVSNPTLDFATSCGMKLIFVDRSTFRDITADFPFEVLGIDVAGGYFLPEGGTNNLALHGAAELADESIAQLGFTPDYFCLPAGTGGTAAGLINGLKGRAKVLAFSALKGDFLKTEIGNYLDADAGVWSLETDYHFGGYARHNASLIAFINDFKEKYGIQLDPVYTGKMMFGIIDKVNNGHFPPGSNILAIHTGGLQGNEGFRFRYGDLLK